MAPPRKPLINDTSMGLWPILVAINFFIIHGITRDETAILLNE